MRFAFVVSLWFPFGGMQNSLIRIARACVDRGHQVDIYAGGWHGERPDGIGVIELDAKAITNHGSNDLLAERFAAAVADKDYDCRVGFTKIPGLDVYYAADPCFVARVEDIKRQHPEIKCVAEVKYRLYKLLPRYRAYCRQERAVFQPGANTDIVLIGHHEEERFIRHYVTEGERFHLMPPGLNRNHIKTKDSALVRNMIRQEFQVGEHENMLLVVGSRFKTKGVDRVIRAMASLPGPLLQKSKLIVVGYGKPRFYRWLVAYLGLSDQVFFAGTRDDVRRFYRAADYLIHAPRSENTGTILLEAMLCGLPVLATDNCGFAKHVRDADAGMTVLEPYNQKKFNKALADILQSDLRDDWTTNGPEYCANTDLYSLIERVADVIEERAERNATHQG